MRFVNEPLVGAPSAIIPVLAIHFLMGFGVLCVPRMQEKEGFGTLNEVDLAWLKDKSW